jgi:hypothetical protein
MKQKSEMKQKLLTKKGQDENPGISVKKRRKKAKEQ